MAQKRKMLNVRSFLENVIDSCDSMLERTTKNHLTTKAGAIVLPACDLSNLNELRFFAKAILRKHESKKTRKDIYVERP